MTTDTRTKLLDAAYSLMLSKGYPATSVDEICEAAGVSKGSCYHFFRSKQHLTLAMLEHHMQGAKETLEAGLDLAGVDGPDRTLAYVRHIERLSAEIWKDGCLIGSLALEMAETNPEVQGKLSAIFNDLTSHFEDLFRPFCNAYVSGSSPTPRELAEQLLVVIEGGVVLSRAHRDSKFVPQAIRGFRLYLELLAKTPS